MHKGNDDFIMYKGKTIGMDLNQNVLKVDRGSAGCLETMVNSKHCQLLFLDEEVKQASSMNSSLSDNMVYSVVQEE